MLNALLSHVKIFSSDVIFLMESKLLANQVPRLAIKIGYPSFFCVERVGLSGGLVLLWKDQLVVRVNSYARLYIDAYISSANVLPWRFSGIYGDQILAQRKKKYLGLSAKIMFC